MTKNVSQSRHLNKKFNPNVLEINTITWTPDYIIAFEAMFA